MSTHLTVPTGLLTDSQREFLREGNDEIQNPEQYERKIRHQASKRVEKLPEDLTLLESHGHDDIVAQFYHEVDKIERLRRALGAYGVEGADAPGDTDD